ncbi:MAG: hypothetical protein GY810_23190 [Aureispira sp.]|nr:hypothetical protein [Aureispira sp.]
MNRAFSHKEILLLQILTITIFIGRAWQGIFWDLPLRSLLWDQNLMQGIVESIYNGSWHEYVTDPKVDTFINNLGVTFGVFWAICASIILVLKPNRKWLRIPIYIGAALLIGLAFLYWKSKYYALGQLFEYSIQISTPILLVYAVLGGFNSHKFRGALKVIIAISFICHGLYAYGYYPVPGPWLQWCLDVFMLPTESSAYTFLYLMGILDFLAAILIFFRPTFNIAIWYCIIWGTMTALARIVANFYIDAPLYSLHQWGYETMFRLVHGGLPFFLWLISKNSNNK